MAEVSGRIIEKFAANLAALLASAPAAGVAASNGSGPAADAAGPGAAGGAADGAADPASLEELQLPGRAYNSLRRVGIHTVDDLSARTEADLLAIENLGPQSVREIKERLAGIGRHLAEQPAGASLRGPRPAGGAPRRRGRRRTCRGASPGGARPGPGGRVPGCPAARRGRHRPAQRGRLPGAEAGTAGARRGGRPATGDLRPAARPPQGLTAGCRPLAAARWRRRAAGRWPPSAVRQRSETLPPVQGRALSIPGPAVRRLQ